MPPWLRGTIYALIDRRTGEHRYVGQTRQYPSVRLADHRRGRSGQWCARWIASIGPENVDLVVLEEPPLDELDAAEVRWIEEGRRRGWPLTNLADGGHPTPTRKCPPECTCGRHENMRRIRFDSTGVKRTPETRARMSEAQQQAWTPELRAQHSERTVQRLRAAGKEARHGTHSKYALGCKCDLCRAAEREYQRDYRRRRRTSAEVRHEHDEARR